MLDNYLFTRRNVVVVLKKHLMDVREVKDADTVTNFEKDFIIRHGHHNVSSQLSKVGLLWRDNEIPLIAAPPYNIS